MGGAGRFRPPAGRARGPMCSRRTSWCSMVDVTTTAPPAGGREVPLPPYFPGASQWRHVSREAPIPADRQRWPADLRSILRTAARRRRGFRVLHLCFHEQYMEVFGPVPRSPCSSSPMRIRARQVLTARCRRGEAVVGTLGTCVRRWLNPPRHQPLYRGRVRVLAPHLTRRPLSGLSQQTCSALNAGGPLPPPSQRAHEAMSLTLCSRELRSSPSRPRPQIRSSPPPRWLPLTRSHLTPHAAALPSLDRPRQLELLPAPPRPAFRPRASRSAQQ